MCLVHLDELRRVEVQLKCVLFARGAGGHQHRVGAVTRLAGGETFKDDDDEKISSLMNKRIKKKKTLETIKKLLKLDGVDVSYPTTLTKITVYFKAQT